MGMLLGRHRKPKEEIVEAYTEFEPLDGMDYTIPPGEPDGQVPPPGGLTDEVPKVPASGEPTNEVPKVPAPEEPTDEVPKVPAPGEPTDEIPKAPVSVEQVNFDVITRVEIDSYALKLGIDTTKCKNKAEAIAKIEECQQ